MSRLFQGTLNNPDNPTQPLAYAYILIHAGAWSEGGVAYPPVRKSVKTNAAGEFSIAIDVPTTGSIPFRAQTGAWRLVNTNIAGGTTAPIPLEDVLSTGGSTAPRLSALVDVNIPAPADGQALVYDGIAEEWYAETLAGGGIHDHDTVYYTETEVDTFLSAKLDGATFLLHTGDNANPHQVTKDQVGLGNVTNVNAVPRANHTGTQLLATISNAGGAASLNVGAIAGTVAAGDHTHAGGGHSHDDLYYTEAQIDTFLSAKLDGATFLAHTGDDANPHQVDAAQVGAYTTTQTDTLLGTKAEVVHNHDDLYYTEAEIDTALGDKAAAVHDHDPDYAPAPTTLTDGATITWDIDSKQSAIADLLIGGTNRQLALSNVPATGLVTGALRITQNTGGNFTLLLPASGGGIFHLVSNGGAGAILLSTAASKIDLLTFVKDGNYYLWTLGKDYT